MGGRIAAPFGERRAELL